MSVYIIAEAGVNHNGDIYIAKRMIDEAKAFGADCIKFQTFISKNLVSKNANKAEYQKKNTQNNNSQLDMLKELELSYKQFEELKNYCNRIGIEFLSTPFDLDSITFLHNIGMDKWKIPSGDITNLPYLEKIAQYNEPIILSTGMATIDEISQSINSIRKFNNNNLTLLHCTTEYPAPYDEINLRVLETLSEKYKVDVGYSDHSKGIEVSIAAVALGAKIIEKHFTLDNRMKGPDHKASLEPTDFKYLVDSIRNVEKALGSNIKQPTKSELKNKNVARKSIIAKTNIKKGDIFNISNITVKRPGLGISPMKWHDIIGRKAKKDFEEDDLIEL
ncbi:N-acetylneuraminate synthase [bacterium]|nr:N-acetylneuraminate synthase [bacterium]